MVKTLPRIFATSIFWIALTFSATATAYHTDKERQTDFSAFTLQAKQGRIGLFQIEYGIYDWWTVGSYTAPWLLIPFTGQFSGDAYTKFKLIDSNGWAVSIRPTMFYLRVRDLKIGNIQDADFDASLFPVSATLTRVFDKRWTLSLETTWVQMLVGADATSVDNAQALGAAAQSNFQLALNAEYRINKVIALNLITRYVPFVTNARFTSTAQVDEFTTAEINAGAEFEDLENAFIIQPGVTFSWKRFNLQLGIGYGNIFVPGLRIVSADRGFTPDLAAYFRF